MNIKLYFTILSLFIIGSSYAQSDLYVGNNVDRFIFVTGDYFLYVEDDINLDGADSRIYLRNEAQLLQNDDATYNRGLGQLSVQQSGTVSEFNYNYWCSPVGTWANPGANDIFIPNLNIYERTGASSTAATIANYTTAYSGTATPFEISNRWLFTYNPGAAYADWDYIGDSGSANPGYGFTMKGVAGTDPDNNPVGNNQLYDFRGKPNTGEINVAVLAPVAAVPQFTLTGNPYPSALDARDFFHQAPLDNQSAINGWLLFWEQNSSSHVLADYVGGYAVYVIDNGGVITYTPAPYNTYDSAGNITGGLGNSPNMTPGVDAPGRYLPVGQGFMVEGLANTDIYFRNSYRQFWRESDGNSFFFGIEDQSQNIGETQIQPNNSNSFDANDNGGSPLPDNYMRFRIVVDIEPEEGYYSRELVVNMVDYATEELDYGMEAKHPDILDSDAHWMLEEEPFVILAVPFLEERKIPLIVQTESQQNVRIRAYALQNFPEDLPVYVHDIENELYVDLRQQNYELNLEAGTYKDRFEITFLNFDTLDLDDATLSDFQIFQDNGQSQLTVLNPNNLELQKVQLFDVAGKLIFSSDPLETLTEYHFSTKTLSDGVYVATLSIADQIPIHKKVLIKNK